jgi:hypothetical protein
MPAKPYNGHRSWNAWNVALWLNNDESLYREMLHYIKTAKNKNQAAARMARDYAGHTTPDGGRYNPTVIREAMAGIEA